MTTTDKVQVGDSTTGTSTSTTWHYPYTRPKPEQGWECPRCGRINAPWKSQCDCSGNQWTITTNWDTTPIPTQHEWWKDYVTCSGADSATTIGKTTTTWSAINMDVGGSDYWNSATQSWANGPKTYTNQLDNNSTSINNPWEHLFNLTEQFTQLQNEIDNLKETK